MRKIYLSILIFIVTKLFSQGETDVSSLKAPSSPAFAILGIQPSQVTHPKTYNDLETAWMNNFLSDGKLTVPLNFALEFSPYWIFHHKNLTYKQYINPTNKQLFGRSFSLSIATADRRDSITNNAVRQLSWGFRFQIPLGKNAQKANPAVLKELNLATDQLDLMEQVSGLIVGGLIYDSDNYKAENLDAKRTQESKDFLNSQDQVAFIKKITTAYFSIYVNSPRFKQDKKAYNKIFNELLQSVDWTSCDMSSLEAALSSFRDDVVPTYMNSKQSKEWVGKNVTDNIKKINAEPWGNFLEFAAAGSQDFKDTNNYNKNALGKLGCWFTYTYRTKQINQVHQIEVNAMARFLHDETLPIQRVTNFDAGVKITYTYKDKFSLNGEYISRNSWLYSGTNKNLIYGGNKVDYRVFFNMAYRVNKLVSITYGIGRDFDHNLITNGNLLSLLGLNVGIGSPKIQPATN